MPLLRHVLNLSLHPEIPALDVPPSIEVHGFSLLKIQEWRGLILSGSVTDISHVWVDLDDIARTDPLDTWSLSAWRASLNDFIVKSIGPSGLAPTLVGYTREKTWERAQMGVQVGIRDLLSREELMKSLATDRDDASTPPAPENIVSLSAVRTFQGDFMSGLGVSEIIPKHVIPFPIDGLDGSSSAVEALRGLIRRSAPMDTPILLRGPTGSGKELVARSLHRYSPRASAPFVAVNCGAISPGILESELFGHVKGAFTNAYQDKMGLFEKAEGGTLFLDEISELPLEVQVKLLRAIQERQVTRVGGTDSIPVDVRLVSATKDDLDERCREGRFRQDLLYRIKVIEIILPALVERRLDIPELARTLLKKIARRNKRPQLDTSNEVIEKFLLHSWPGNIREFENVLEHAATLTWAEARNSIQLSDLPEEIQFSTMTVSTSQHLKDVVRRFEKEYIATTVRRLGGSKEEAADVLGLSLATLYRKLGS